MKKVFGAINPASTPEEIADIIYEAATDNNDQLRYVAGSTANTVYARRLEIGEEDFRKETKQKFLNLLNN